MKGGPFFLQSLDRLEVGYALVDEKLRVLTCNEAFARLVGVPRAGMLEGRALDEDADPVRVGLLRRAKAGEFIHAHQSFSLVPGTAVRDLDVRMNRVELPDRGIGVVVVAVPLDSAGDLLVSRANLAALGRMAAGLAHEFNNLHAGILGYVEYLLQERTDLDGDLAEDLREIHGLAQRAAAITRNLMAFAAQDHSLLGPVDPGDLAKEAVGRIEQRARSEAVSVRTESEGRLPGIYVDRAQIVQVLENLLENALDAVFASEDRSVVLRMGQTEDHVWFEVVDSGRGMDDKVLERAFEPFFTTKGSAATSDSPEASLRGVGLGLSVCKTLVEQHGGRLKVRSKPGEGTTVRVELPKLLLPGSASPGDDGYGPRVLIVEDEASIRKLLVRGAELEGFETDAAADGAEGLERIRSGRYGIVVLDLQMPGVDGRHVLAELAKMPEARRPKVLVTTGRITLLGERQRPEDRLVTLVLRKPFSLEKYQEALRELAEAWKGRYRG